MVCYPIRMAALEDNDVTQQRARLLTACRHLKIFVYQRGLKLDVCVLRHISHKVDGASTLLHNHASCLETLLWTSCNAGCVSRMPYLLLMRDNAVLSQRTGRRLMRRLNPDSHVRVECVLDITCFSRC
jgi:hypothetical protein